LIGGEPQTEKLDCVWFFLVGAGGGLDISNLMKPALARGELQCIGATTLDEHRKHIEKDMALER
jgi:ATP-dependent Clp protease ATP-binding subunit ClpA